MWYTDAIYCARVTPGGTVLDPIGIKIYMGDLEEEYPSVAFDGANFWVVWQDTRNGFPWRDIYGARVTPQGVVLDPGGVPICTTSSYRDDHPAIAFGATNCLAVFQRLHGTTSTRGVRITPDGVVLDPGGFLISFSANDQEKPSVAFDGANYFAVWSDYRKGSYFDCDLYGARVREDGTVLDPVPLAIWTRERSQRDAVLAFDGTNYLVVWEEVTVRPGSSWVYGARVSQAGVVLDTLGIAICTTDHYKRHPAVSFDGTNYLAVWQCS